jgi:hypothetical protein
MTGFNGLDLLYSRCSGAVEWIRSGSSLQREEVVAKESREALRDLPAGRKNRVATLMDDILANYFNRNRISNKN